MEHPRRILLIILPALLTLLDSCSTRPPADMNAALTLYRANKLQEALPMFEQLAAQDANDPEHHTWLAETYRRLGKKEEAVKSARHALELNPRSSFAHMVIAEASNPLTGEWAGAHPDTTWIHVMRAIECDSNDGHPWLLAWGEAIRLNDPLLVRKAQGKFKETGFLTPAALAYGRWMLRGLPKNAVLLTNGDMDTYPPLAVQEAEGFRKDVAVVNRGTLNESWYARFVRDHAGVALPMTDAELDRLAPTRDTQGRVVPPSDHIFRGWLEAKARGSFTRPLAVAITVGDDFLTPASGHLRSAGAFQLWTAGESGPDTASMRAGLVGVSPSDFAGPWVSEQDRSPVRRVGTKNIIRNVTATAIAISESLLERRKKGEAKYWLDWAEELDRTAELGPVFGDTIARLREQLSSATP